MAWPSLFLALICSNFRLMLTSGTSHDNREIPAKPDPIWIHVLWPLLSSVQLSAAMSQRPKGRSSTGRRRDLSQPCTSSQALEEEVSILIKEHHNIRQLFFLVYRWRWKRRRIWPAHRLTERLKRPWMPWIQLYSRERWLVSFIKLPQLFNLVCFCRDLPA